MSATAAVLARGDVGYMRPGENGVSIASSMGIQTSKRKGAKLHAVGLCLNSVTMMLACARCRCGDGPMAGRASGSRPRGERAGLAFVYALPATPSIRGLVV